MKVNDFLQRNKRLFTWLIFGLIIILAVFLRFYKLNNLPIGLSPDEAFYGNQAIDFLKNISLKSLYSAILQGGIFVKFIIVSVKIFGNNIISLRIIPAIFGVLAVIMTFFLTRRWFNTRTALITSFLMAISPWMIALSRSVSPASMQPLLISLSLYLATLAILKDKVIFYILLSIVLAAGLYSYFAFFAILPVLAIGIVTISIKNKKLFKKISTNLLICLASLLILLAPMIFVFFRHPGLYVNKINNTIIWSKNISSRSINATADSATKIILAYNFRGDENYRYNLAGLPMLNTFMGVMFVLGIMIALVRIKRLKYILLISLFVFSLLPAILFPINDSISLRLSISAPVVFLLIGVAINYLLAKWYSIFPVNTLARNIGLSLVITLMFLSLWQSYKQFFVAWAQDPKTYYASSQDSTEMAQYLIDSSSKQNPTVFVSMNQHDLATVNYLTNGKAKFTLIDLDKIKALPIDAGKKIFIIQNNSVASEVVNILSAKFPNGQQNEKLSDYTDQKLFYVYVVNQ